VDDGPLFDSPVTPQHRGLMMASTPTRTCTRELGGRPT
jgi:hypothetical protein